MRVFQSQTPLSNRGVIVQKGKIMAQRRRTGIPLALRLGHRMCATLIKFRPIIVSLSGIDGNVGTLIDALVTACNALEDVFQAYENSVTD